MSLHLQSLTITDQFWSHYRELVRTEMIPYQWNVLNDNADITIEKERNDNSIPSEKSHAIENFKIAAGLKQGNHYGWVFQDSDVYKWLEAVAYSLSIHADTELQELADGVIDLISLAQEEDGYLNTYFSIEEPERRFKKLAESHELYCAGHFIEAAVAYYESTHNEKALQIACRLADCIDASFGKGEHQIQGYDGHEEIELALTKLYSLTKEQRYLNLSRYFLYERGTDTTFFARQQTEDTGTKPVIAGMSHRPLEYYQAHQPILEQQTAEGHAVRLVYMCAAMADVALLAGDTAMLEACRLLWKNMITKRMYITGGIGSTVDGEAFTLDYDLPNDTMYCETCASIGLIFFAFNMLKNEARSEYADVLERALYNTAIGGMALDGKHFFYVNPLEVRPENSRKDPGKSHVKFTRPEWFGCACCPPNLARLLTSLHKYIYMVQSEQKAIYTNLFITSTATLEIDHHKVQLEQTTNLPWEGHVSIVTQTEQPTAFTLALRLPYWADAYSLIVNGEHIEAENINGFLHIDRVWQSNDKIEFILPMEIKQYTAHPLVRADIGKVAIGRGPFIYCAEEVDNGEHLHLIQLNKDQTYQYTFDPQLLGGIGTIDVEARKRIITSQWEDVLYASQAATTYAPTTLRLIPYYCWANRQSGEMRVWHNQA
ncbi:glycoside hydrolase family 127 protein [Paenibacillus sp. KACC 21273]|uniref:glycoside hydrolase family 127 protein n=1 Tax=Paenibacillus sp. KACC 21273 TaxID=3025665 RepID=UPI0023650FCB|nr:beta-L-arabinofuranosidase domain-containing protein [Paenibacillus sp. KACC 21273]WDF52749.1 glycoside hydrolase family 127 protein [Paenibacillus sp. KACC 21273]